MAQASNPIIPLSILLVLAVGGALVAVYRHLQAKERTLRHHADRERALEAQFDDLFERTADIVVVHDRHGRISTMDRTAEQLSGYPRQEARTIVANSRCDRHRAQHRRRGFTVLEARHGGEALEICQEYGGTIDVLLTAVVMPTMNGVALAAAVGSRRSKVPVLFMSATLSARASGSISSDPRAPI